MKAYDIIAKKRDGLKLSREELEFMVQGFVRNEIPDYQVSAWLMACYLNDLDEQEMTDLTDVMANSGKKIDLTAIPGRKVDKHSTGGVGDKTTLVVLSMVAACGVPVAKMSGRGLGYTGGTLDKLESIPGFQVDMTTERLISQVKEIGLALASASTTVDPADKKLYALRDVTATVSSIPLIASSVMSKKIAGGADAIVLDIKTGSGAFMKTRDDAEKLARALVMIGEKAGKDTTAVISNMDEPLGQSVGNALEVREAIETLKDRGPADLKELSLVLGAQMLVLGGRTDDLDPARQLLEESLRSGAALDKFKQMVKMQGGETGVIDDPERLPKATIKADLPAFESGYIISMDAEKIGRAAVELGAGRIDKESTVDLSVGLVMKVKVGDAVVQGDTLVEIHANDYTQMDRADSLLTSAIMTSTDRPTPKPLVCDIIRSKKQAGQSNNK